MTVGGNEGNYEGNVTTRWAPTSYKWSYGAPRNGLKYMAFHWGVQTLLLEKPLVTPTKIWGTLLKKPECCHFG